MRTSRSVHVLVPPLPLVDIMFRRKTGTMFRHSKRDRVVSPLRSSTGRPRSRKSAEDSRGAVRRGRVRSYRADWEEEVLLLHYSSDNIHPQVYTVVRCAFRSNASTEHDLVHHHQHANVREDHDRSIDQ